VSLAPAVILRGFLNQLGFAMWTPTTRQQHSRPVTRYQTDLIDAEWRLITPHLPKPNMLVAFKASIATPWLQSRLTHRT
jgi:hypothetical protein